MLLEAKFFALKTCSLIYLINTYLVYVMCHLNLNKYRADSWFLPLHLVLVHSFPHLFKPYYPSPFPLAQVKNPGSIFDYSFFLPPHPLHQYVSSYIQKYIVNRSIFLHPLLPGIPIGFLLQHLRRSHKNPNSQNCLLKMNTWCLHFRLKVCHWLHTVLEINPDSLSCS